MQALQRLCLEYEDDVDNLQDMLQQKDLELYQVSKTTRRGEG
jgi:hypothetical protein